VATPEDTRPTPTAKPWPFVNSVAAQVDDLAELSRQMFGALTASEEILALAAQYRAPEQARAKEVYEQTRAVIAAAKGKVPPTIDWLVLSEALADLEGIGHVLLDLATAAEGDGAIHHRSLFFLGMRAFELQKQIDKATGIAGGVR